MGPCRRDYRRHRQVTFMQQICYICEVKDQISFLNRLAGNPFGIRIFAERDRAAFLRGRAHLKKKRPTNSSTFRECTGQPLDEVWAEGRRADLSSAVVRSSASVFDLLA